LPSLFFVNLKHVTLFPTRTVPTGVSEVLVNATGAQGGDIYAAGGLGGWVQASLSVTAGQTLYVFVGGDSVVGPMNTVVGPRYNEGGYNGGGAGDGYHYGSSGGGGGGATDIRTTSSDLKSRLIVAGGGGGANKNDCGGNGGTVTNCLRFKAAASDYGVDRRYSQCFSFVTFLQRLILYSQEEQRENPLACSMIMIFVIYGRLLVALKPLAECLDYQDLTVKIFPKDLLCTEPVAWA
jgi:Glycine rich protein